MHPRIVTAQPKASYHVELTFADGSRGVADLARWIRESTGVFAALRDPAFFARVSVDPEAGTVVWPNGADLDPDVLYRLVHESCGATAEHPPRNGHH